LVTLQMFRWGYALRERLAGVLLAAAF
jgi:hypothetical protein